MGNQKQTQNRNKKIPKMWKIGHSKFSFQKDIDLILYVGLDHYYDLHSHNNHHALDLQ